jgi:hypothetical protein
MRLNPRGWFGTKLGIAQSLAAQNDPPGETEAQIAICCAASALAALMWPGKRGDSRSLIQSLVDYGPRQHDFTTVSVPTLASSQRGADANRFPERFLPRLETKVVDALQINQPETAIQELLPNVPLKTIRYTSYASIICTDLRCALVHEYKLSEAPSSFGMSLTRNLPSYANITAPIPGQDVADAARTLAVSRSTARRRIVRTVRRLYLPYKYLRESMRDTASNVFDCWDQAAAGFQSARPSPRWIDA